MPSFFTVYKNEIVLSFILFVYIVKRIHARTTARFRTLNSDNDCNRSTRSLFL